MDSEHRRLVERLQDKNTSGDGSFRYVEGTLGGNHVILTQCGIGKVSAAVGASELIRRFSPNCIVSTGVAGGIDACLKVTDVVASQRLVYHDVWCGDGNEYGQVQGFPASYEGCSSLLKHALSLNEAGMESRIHSGLVCTGDQFITYREMNSHAYLTEELEGDGVEMEGASVALVCSVNRVPFLVARTISDRADEDAATNFEAFLPQASRNSLDLVRYLLREMAQVDLGEN